MIDYYSFMENVLSMFWAVLPYIMLVIGIRALFVISFKKR